MPDTYTVRDVAEMLDRNPETIRRWIRQGYLKAARIGREYRISAADLNAWCASRGGGRLVAAEETPAADVDLEEP